MAFGFPSIPLKTIESLTPAPWSSRQQSGEGSLRSTIPHLIAQRVTTPHSSSSLATSLSYADIAQGVAEQVTARSKMNAFIE
jgi:hypothetical protein